MMKSAKRCSKCILTEHYKDISFNAEGICNFCLDDVKDNLCIENDQALYNIASNRIGQYDVLVGYSGGKDSTYILYQLIKKYKLKVLAFTFDNYFVSDASFANINKISKILNFDHIIFKYNFDFTKTVFRKSIKLAKNNVCEDMFRQFGIVCWPCFVLISIAAFNIAKSYGIKHICGGWSFGQISNLYKISTNNQDGFIDSDLIRNNFINVFLNKLCLENQEPQIELYKRNDNQFSIIPYFLFEKYDENNIFTTIKENLSWEQPLDTDGCSTNCLLNSYGNNVFEDIYKYNRYEEQLSRQVRKGLIDREQALASVLNKGDKKIIDNIKKYLEK